MEENKMPGFDGTGPNGEGPMTGRGLGYCRGFFRRGRGFGRGFRWRARAFQMQPQVIPVIKEPQLTEAEEKKMLQEELEYLKEEMKDIEKRLKELKD